MSVFVLSFGLVHSSSEIISTYKKLKTKYVIISVICDLLNIGYRKVHYWSVCVIYYCVGITTRLQNSNSNSIKKNPMGMRTSDCFSFVHFFTVKKLAVHIPVINVAILYLSSVLFVHSFRNPSSKHTLATHTYTLSQYEPDVLPIISHLTGILCMSICSLSIIQTVAINFSHKVVYYLPVIIHGYWVDILREIVRNKITHRSRCIE